MGVLVGRERELDELRGAMRRCRQRAFRCVVLEGEPGIGKTRLASEFVAQHRGKALVLQARGYPYGEATPFGLWAEAFESHLRGLRDQQVVDLCGAAIDDLAPLLRSASAAGGGGAGPAGHGGPSVVRQRESLAVLLSALAKRQPVVVVLDDLHLADVSSWEAFDYLAHNLTDARVLVVGCLRRGELSGVSAAKHVLFRLEQDGILQRVGVPALHGDELRALAESVLRRTSVPPATLRWLADRSGGNPLLALGLLEALVEEGRDLSAPALAAVPASLGERLAHRLATLSTESQEVLDLLAVLGHRVDLDDLRKFSRRSLTTLAEVLPRLIEAQLVDERDDPVVVDYGIVHPLMQELIYERLGGARRRALHRRIGRALATSGRLGEAAPHLARSATPGDEEAIDALARAASETWKQHAFAESFLVAHAMLELIPAGDERWLDLLDMLSPGQEWLFYEHKEDLDTALGVRIMQQMQRILDGSEDAAPARLAAFNLYLSVFLGWGGGDLGEARRRGEDAVEQFRQAGEHQLARLAAHELSWIHGVDGDFAAQERSARGLLHEADAAADAEATILALRSLAGAEWPRGDFDVAASRHQQAADLALGTDNPTSAAHDHAYRALVLAFAGRLDQATAAMAAATAADPVAIGPLGAEIPILLTWLGGDNSRALADARRAAAGMGPGETWVTVIGAFAAIEADDGAEARRLVDTLCDVMQERRFWMMNLSFSWASGLLQWREGDLPAAALTLHATADYLLTIDAVALAGPVLVDLIEVGADADRHDVLGVAVDQLGSIAARVDRPHYRALAALGAGWAAHVSGDDAVAAGHGQRAADHFARSGHRAYEARAVDLVGRACAGEDRRRSAQTLRRAARLFDDCSAGWRRRRTLRALEALGRTGRRTIAAEVGPAPLTAREREVAALALEGLTAREVGQRLYIGERTVETHLANIYAKFGVHSRVELLRTAVDFQL